MEILLITTIIVIVLYLWLHQILHNKGKIGEKKIHRILSKLPKEYHLMEDVVFKTNKGTTQIDHLVVSKYGIFAIETKNYRGKIYGDDAREQWTQIITTDVNFRRNWWKTYTYVTKNNFYNPVKQSLAHVYAIKNCLSDWPLVKIVPIVVFVGEARLIDVQSNHHVIYANELISTIQSYGQSYLTDIEVQEILDKLTAKDVRKEVSNKIHIRNIKETKDRKESMISSGICPKCGGKLVERRGQFGTFYGCSNYPNCKFTVK